MNQVQKSIKPFVSGAEKFLNRGLDNVYINTAIKVFLALYAALAAPQLPPVVAGLLDNLVVRVFFAFVIVFVALRDAGIALMLAVAYIVTLQTVNKMNLVNTDLSTSSNGELSWLPSAKGALEFFKGILPESFMDAIAKTVSVVPTVVTADKDTPTGPTTTGGTTGPTTTGPTTTGAPTGAATGTFANFN